jgi:hypothetical protein
LPGDNLGRRGLELRRLAASESLAVVAAPAVAGLLTLLFVLPTLAPGVLFWDTAEFQTVGPVLGTAHPTGYPSYIILGWLASIVLQPFGDPAYRMNLLQAILAAAAIAGATAIVQVLTGRRMIALAVGLLLAWTQLFWRLSTHADPHMFHIALTAFLFVALLVWDQRRHSKDSGTLAHADRWLVAAAGIYGVAVANHSLALLLPPAIGLFVLAADWRAIFRWRTIVACLAVLAGTIAVLFAELPIRAAMHAPLVYGHPDTLSGFQYVVLAEQFRGSLQNPFGDLPSKAASVMNLMTGWLGPIGLLAAVGLGTSIYRRPRYVLLSGLSLLVTCVFAASYANADIERYYLLPLMIAFTWVGLGVADIVAGIGWAAGEYERRYGPGSAVAVPGDTTGAAMSSDSGADAVEPPGGEGRTAWAVLAAEMAFAAVLVFTSVGVISQRQGINAGDNPGGVSEAQNTSDSVWMRQVLAPPEQGGLAQNAVIETWWSASTTLWYGQKVLGMRPDVLIIDDSTRKNDRIGAGGEVWDVFDTYLATRPVYTDRIAGGCDGIQALGAAYNLDQTGLREIYRVTSRIQPPVALPPCDPVKP